MRRSQTRTRLRLDPAARHLLSFLLIAGFVLGIVAVSGNLVTGPRIVDDNQIFSLNELVSQKGSRIAFAAQVRSRARWGRLLPVFLAEKVFKARVYGSRIGFWKAHVIGLGILAGWVLYLFLYHAGFKWLESFVFAFLILIGPQSVLWVRLIHGEGLGLVLFALSLACLLVAVRVDRWRPAFDLLFISFVVAAAMSKESFLLTVPALLLWRFVLMGELRGWTVREALERSKGVGLAVIVLGLVGLAGGFLLRSKFAGWYVGYDQLELRRLLRALYELFTATGGWFVAGLAGCLALIALRVRHSTDLGHRLAGLGGYVGVVILLMAPQVVLYSKLGFLSPRHPELSVPRYLVPAVCGVALTVALCLREIRKLANESGNGGWGTRLARAVPLVVLALLMAHQVFAASSTTTRFARRTALQNDLLDFVRWNTDAEDVILVVYDGDRPAFRRRVATLLREYVGRPRIMPFPVAADSPSRQERAQAVRSRTLTTLRQQRQSPGAIVVESKGRVQQAFRREAAAWFSEPCHRRYHDSIHQEAFVPARCTACATGSER